MTTERRPDDEDPGDEAEQEEHEADSALMLGAALLEDHGMTPDPDDPDFKEMVEGIREDLAGDDEDLGASEEGRDDPGQ